MQIFSCPFCGPRPETEFHFGGDASNARPAPDCSAEDWAAYLYVRNNPKGGTTEVWVHLTCAEFFTMRRDSVTMAASPGIALSETAL